MTELRLIFRELFSIFVDDVPVSLAIIAWVAFVTLALPALLGTAASHNGLWGGLWLFLGCAAILTISAWRAATKPSER